MVRTLPMARHARLVAAPARHAHRTTYRVSGDPRMARTGWRSWQWARVDRAAAAASRPIGLAAFRAGI